MNRNTMYHYLKDIGMYPVVHRNGKRYYIEFVKDKDKNQTIDGILMGWGKVEGFESIHLCRQYIMLESMFSKIYIKYSAIDKFEVLIYDDDDY